MLAIGLDLNNLWAYSNFYLF